MYHLKNNKLRTSPSPILLLFMCLLLSVLTCQKEHFDIDPASAPLAGIGGSEGSGESGWDDYRPTILGTDRTNPYTKTVMTNAWNELYPDYQVSNLPVTHLYVKFTPADYPEIVILDSLDIDMRDHPLTYEIIQHGDYYMPEGMTDDDIPVYYGVVEPGFVSPIAGYEVLEELVIPPYTSYLTAKAFSMTNNEHDFDAGTDTGGGGGGGNCYEGCPGFPCCLYFEDIGCDDPVVFDPAGPHCEPNSPIWPLCLEIACEPPSPPPTPPMTTCGCPSFVDDRKPAGCVDVVDSQLGPDPVPNVRVQMWDGWFKFRNVFTDAGGCFKWNEVIGSHNKLRINVKFKNSIIKVRNLNSWRFWEYFFAVRDKRGKQPKPYNDLLIRYPITGDLNSKAKRNWMAAIANNAIHDFHGFAGQEGISPPGYIEVLNTGLFGSGGSTPMMNYIGNPWGYLAWILGANSTPKLLNLLPKAGFDVHISISNNATDIITAILAIKGKKI